MEQERLNGVNFINVIKTQGIDQAISIAGAFHKYQYKLMVCLGLQWLITSFVLMIQPFLMQTPTFLCQDTTDPTKSYICEEKEACKQQSFSIIDNFPDNAVTEFNLYCERSNLRELCGTIFFFGGGIGTLLFSHAADKYGRKKALFMAFTLGAISLLLMALLSFDMVQFYLFLGMSWAGFDAYFAFSFIMLSEAGGAKLRGISNAFLLIIWGMGLCVFVVIACFVQSWRSQLLWFIAVPACVSILLFTQMYESPRFLYTKGRYEQCQKVLTAIAKQNKKLKTKSNGRISNEVLNVVESDEFPQLYQETSTQETSYATLFQNSWLRKRFLLFTALVLYLYLSYNGILFALADIGGDIYENSLIVSAAELTGYIVSIFMLNKIKRKISFILIMLSAAISGLLFASVPYVSCQGNPLCSQEFLEGVLSLVIKFCISLSFGLIFVYGAELFPTVARSKCIGLGASLGRGASMATTWINHGLLVWGIKPMFFYGSLGFVMLLLVNKLPETFGQDLSDYLPEETYEKKGRQIESPAQRDDEEREIHLDDFQNACI